MYQLRYNAGRVFTGTDVVMVLVGGSANECIICVCGSKPSHVLGCHQTVNVCSCNVRKDKGRAHNTIAGTDELNLAMEPHNLPRPSSRIRKCWSLLRHDIIITNNSWSIYLSMLITIGKYLP